MKKGTVLLIYLLILMGVFLVFASSCQKDDDDNGNSSNNNEGVPVLSTTEVTDITQTTAKSGGNITSDGGNNVTARGVCWSTGQNPTTSDNKTTDGTGVGSFVSSISGLSANTTYYIRAYASNSNGTGYGSAMSLTTTSNNPDIPILTTKSITHITQTTAISGGNITSDGGATLIARGVCWSAEQNPTISDNKTTDGTGVGSFGSSISGLSANTTYYVRAYATNSNGTGYGGAISFTTLGSMGDTYTDPRDGSVYEIVTIGTQVWMAENLKYLPSVVGYATGSHTTPYYYVYGYNGTDVNAAKATYSYTTYGVLYNWPAAMAGSASSAANPSGVQGVCPPGWHLPSDAEWTQLTDYLGGPSIAGGKLKATSHWTSPNGGATNESGFTALPGGWRRHYGAFEVMFSFGYWWSATESSTNEVWNRNLYWYDGGFYNDNNIKDVGFSVRCLKD